MRSKIFLIGLVSATLGACGGESTPEAKSPEPPPSEMSSAPMPPEPMPAPEPAPAPSPPVDTTPAPQAAPAPPPLSDAEIAGVTDAANTGEVEQATLAQKKAKNARVKKFAGMMIAHHSQAKQKQAQLLKKLKVTAAESAKSTALATEGKTTLETLKSADAATFDVAYIDAQVAAHQKVLDAFDKELIPAAQNADLKASLEDFRPKVEAHLKEARDLQQVLVQAPGAGAAAAAAAPTAPKK